jgi:hypothetical protein
LASILSISKQREVERGRIESDLLNILADQNRRDLLPRRSAEPEDLLSSLAGSRPNLTSRGLNKDVEERLLGIQKAVEMKPRAVFFEDEEGV